MEGDHGEHVDGQAEHARDADSTRQVSHGVLKIKISTGKQCCGSKYIEFGCGSRILAQVGSGSRVMQSILKEKLKIILENNHF